jgi:multidrug resistance efflux pump
VLSIPPENVKTYLAEHGAEVEKAVLAMLDRAELIWSKDGKDYFIQDIFLLVAAEQVVITLVKNDYGFDEEMNRQIVIHLLERFYEKRRLLEERSETAGRRQAEIRASMGKVEQKIRHLESQVRERQAALRQLSAQSESIEADLEVLRKDVDQYRHQLVYSTAFKMEELRTKKRA